MSRINGWTEERRMRQRALIQNWKPWERSTGPKTPEGKVKVSQNAYKGGGSAAAPRFGAVAGGPASEIESIRVTTALADPKMQVNSFGDDGFRH